MRQWAEDIREYILRSQKNDVRDSALKSLRDKAWI